VCDTPLFDLPELLPRIRASIGIDLRQLVHTTPTMLCCNFVIAMFVVRWECGQMIGNSIRVVSRRNVIGACAWKDRRSWH